MAGSSSLSLMVRLKSKSSPVTWQDHSNSITSMKVIRCSRAIRHLHLRLTNPNSWLSMKTLFTTLWLAARQTLLLCLTRQPLLLTAISSWYQKTYKRRCPYRLMQTATSLCLMLTLATAFSLSKSTAALLFRCSQASRRTCKSGQISFLCSLRTVPPANLCQTLGFSSRVSFRLRRSISCLATKDRSKPPNGRSLAFASE